MTAPGNGDDDRPAAAPPVEVPWRELSPAALRGVVEAFVLREGTDYGAVETSFASKVAAVMRQLERGEARIFYEPASRSVELVASHALPGGPTPPGQQD